MATHRDPHTLVIEALQRRYAVATRLRAVGEMRQWLEELEPALVAGAREDGQSWEAIADALGRSKQAVWERYRSTETTARS
jgi:hypothetical protein